MLNILNILIGYLQKKCDGLVVIKNTFLETPKTLKNNES